MSGSVASAERPGFAILLNKLEEGDVLVVTKLDRLGRNAMDVRSTVEALTGMGVRVNCLALGNIDLTSPAGKMTMQVINAIAEFERDLLIERTQAGLSRAKAEGKILGRRPTFSDKQSSAVRGRPGLPSGVRFLGDRLLVAGHPAGEGPRRDDGDEILDCVAESFAEFDQPGSFLLGNGDSLGQLFAEDAVLGFEELDHAGELGIGSTPEEGEEWVQEPHRYDPSFS